MARKINENKFNSKYITSTKGISVAGTTATFRNINERDSVSPDRQPTFAWVEDATADPTVNVGSAFYYNKAGTWVKLYETECMDQEGVAIRVDWSSILGKPTASVAAIDASVAASHAHANKSVLDHFNITVDGKLTFNDQIVGDTSEIETRISNLESGYCWIEL